MKREHLWAVVLTACLVFLMGGNGLSFGQGEEVRDFSGFLETDQATLGVPAQRLTQITGKAYVTLRDGLARGAFVIVPGGPDVYQDAAHLVGLIVGRRKTAPESFEAFDNTMREYRKLKSEANKNTSPHELGFDIVTNVFTRWPREDAEASDLFVAVIEYLWKMEPDAYETASLLSMSCHLAQNGIPVPPGAVNVICEVLGRDLSVEARLPGIMFLAKYAKEEIPLETIYAVVFHPDLAENEHLLTYCIQALRSNRSEEGKRLLKVLEDLRDR